MTYVSAGGQNERLAAVEQGQATATLLTDLTKVIAQHQGFKVLAAMADYDTHYPNQVVMSTPSFMDANPEVTEKFLKATLDASNWIYDNPEEALEIVMKRVTADKDVLAEMISAGIENKHFTTDGAVSLEGLQWACDLIATYTDQAVPESVESFVDTSHLPGN